MQEEVRLPQRNSKRTASNLGIRVSHPGDKNKDVAQIHPTNEDLFVGTSEDGARQMFLPSQWETPVAD